MLNALFAAVKTYAGTIGVIQHIDSLFLNPLKDLEVESKDLAIDAIVQILQSHKSTHIQG